MFSGKIGEDIKPYIPNFDIQLIDLNSERDEKLKNLKKRFLTNSLLSLKYHKNSQYIREHFGFLVEVDNDIYQHTMLVFLIENYDISRAEVPKLLENTSKESKSKIMNAIQSYLAEGEAKGIEKERHNGKLQAVKRMIEKELPVSLMIEVLDVTEAFVKGVIAGTVTEIE